MQRPMRSQTVEARSVTTRTALVVMSPFLRRFSAADIRRDVTERLEANGWPCDVVDIGSGADLDAAGVRAREGGYGMVVVAGGDGVVSRIARHLIGSDAILGIIPVGDENGLSMDLGLPQDPSQAAALLVGEHSVDFLDSLQVEDQHFFLQVGTAASTPPVDDALHAS